MTLSPRTGKQIELLIDQACDRFERAWKEAAAGAGQRPAIEDYVAPHEGASRLALLQELLALDVAYRRRLGEQPSQAEYQARFPDAADAMVSLFAGAPSGTPSPSTVGTLEPSCPPPPCAPSGPGGRYEFIEEIAHGGMGVVFRATDTTLGRPVAIKVLHDRFDAASAAAGRFIDEARVTGQLQHPAIPAVHDMGTLANGRPFLAMKLVKGHTLEKLLNERPDPSHDRGRFIAIFEQVCQAVGYAHAHKVIHRDLKPGNVMVGGFGEVQVMDWGLAKVLTASGQVQPREPDPEEPRGTEIRTIRDSDGSYTQAGSILGTPAFMPPEQAGGEIDKIDERADVFGLGAILAVILTGKPPYVATDGETVRLMAVRGQLTDCLARLDGSGAEPGLVALCKRCLAFDPLMRPWNAEVVAKEVAGLRATAEQRARAAELEQVRAEGQRARAEAEAREQRKRRRVEAALGITFTALVILAGAFGWWQWTEANERQQESEEAAEVLKAEKDKTQAALDDSQEKLWLSYLAQARAGRVSMQVGQRFDSLKAIAEAAKIRPDLRLRNEAIACMALTDVRPTTRRFGKAFTHRSTQMVQSATDPSTGAVAAASETTGEVVVRSSTGSIQHRLQHPKNVDNVHWRMDGKLLAVACSTTVTIWRMPEGRRQSILQGHQSSIYALEFSPDGVNLLTNSNDGTTRLWDPIDGRMLLRSVKGQFFGPVQTDSQLLQNGNQTLELATGRDCRVLHCGTIGHGGDYQGHLQGPFECDFSPDGRLLAAALSDLAAPLDIGTIHLWEVETGREVAQLPGRFGVCFAANGDLWVGSRGAVVCWPVGRTHESGTIQFGPPQRVELPAADAFTGWSNRFVSSDHLPILVATDLHRNAVYVIDTERKRFVRQFNQRAAHDAAISPDGRLLAAFSWAWDPPSPASVFDVKMGRLVTHLAMNSYARSAFSPDGKTLAVGSPNDYVLFDTDSWKPNRLSVPWKSYLPARLNFSADGRLLALLAANDLVRLVDPADGKEIATLTPQEAGLVSGVRFNAQGTHLAVPTEGNRIYLWDLRSIRGQLRAMNLDWDHPPLPPAPKDVPPIRVHIKMGPKDAASIQVRPKTGREEASFRVKLAGSLAEKGLRDEAIAEYRKATEADPTYDFTHYQLGMALKQKGDAGGAIAAFRRAWALNPNGWGARLELVQAFGRQGHLGEIQQLLTAWQKLLERNPPDHDSWYGYAELCLVINREDEYRRIRGRLLARFGDTTDPGIASFVARDCLLLPASAEELHRAAVLADRGMAAGPKHPYYGQFLFCRGLAEYRLDHFDKAVAYLQQAGSRGAMIAATRLVLAMARQRTGQSQRAQQILAFAWRAHDWSEDNAYDSNQWIAHILRREAEPLIVPKLSAFLGGNYQPQDNKERLVFTAACHSRKRYEAEAGLYTAAFAAEPALADNLKAFHRYNAACAAALTAAGQGTDVQRLNARERARWRKQALDWLRADLALWTEQLDGTPMQRAALQQKLQWWQRDADLASIRDSDALAKLADDERAACRQLWADVNALLKKAAGEK